MEIEKNWYPIRNISTLTTLRGTTIKGIITNWKQGRPSIIWTSRRISKIIKRKILKSHTSRINNVYQIGMVIISHTLPTDHKFLQKGKLGHTWESKNLGTFKTINKYNIEGHQWKTVSNTSEWDVYVLNHNSF